MAKELCALCNGNGVLTIPGGVSICDRCEGDCWEPENRAALKEPPPVKNNKPFIQNVVIDDIRREYPFHGTAPDVIADLQARKAYGLKKYGTLLQPFNGRDAAMDAYQEALDLVVYLRQMLEERRTASTEVLYYQAMDIAVQLRNQMGVASAQGFPGRTAGSR